MKQYLICIGLSLLAAFCSAQAQVKGFKSAAGCISDKKQNYLSAAQLENLRENSLAEISSWVDFSVGKSSIPPVRINSFYVCGARSRENLSNLSPRYRSIARKYVDSILPKALVTEVYLSALEDGIEANRAGALGGLVFHLRQVVIYNVLQALLQHQNGLKKEAAQHLKRMVNFGVIWTEGLSYYISSSTSSQDEVVDIPQTAATMTPTPTPSATPQTSTTSERCGKCSNLDFCMENIDYCLSGCDGEIQFGFICKSI